MAVPSGSGTAIDWFFVSTAPPVAPQLTVVWFACNENGGPGILPLGTFPNATRRTQAWTPQQHSAPMWHAPPEDKPARVTLASTRARTSAAGTSGRATARLGAGASRRDPREETGRHRVDGVGHDGQDAFVAGRRSQYAAGHAVDPTTDRAREALCGPSSPVGLYRCIFSIRWGATRMYPR